MNWTLVQGASIGFFFASILGPIPVGSWIMNVAAVLALLSIFMSVRETARKKDKEN